MTNHCYMYIDDLIIHEEIKKWNNWEIGVAWIDLTPRGYDADPFRMYSVLLNDQRVLTIAPFRFWLHTHLLPRKWRYVVKYIKTVLGRYRKARISE